MSEVLFWLIFIGCNGLLYLVNYILNFENSWFLPYIKDFVSARKLRLASSVNQDIFRYAVELSIILVCARFINLSDFSFVISGFYFFNIVFNLYQYSLRHIYQAEPNLFDDIELLKNGVVIVWSESKIKVITSLIIVSLFAALIHYFFTWYLSWAPTLPTSIYSVIIVICWSLTLVYTTSIVKFYTEYPNDMYRRYHWQLVEFYFNLKRTLVNYRLSKKKFGDQYSKAREHIVLDLHKNPPNIHIVFLESYGAYYYLEKSIKSESLKAANKFQQDLSESSWSMTSNFSQSPTNGGQSWLTYSSMLYGVGIRDNTHYENFLHDPVFRRSNSLLEILKKSGYTNYNLNPISPIDGINVPYQEMREFYSIDKWILQENINFEGDTYGFGSCPPDQYSMNYTMELIKKAKKHPYIFFYLTKNTHSPFITPPFLSDWQELNKTKGQTHIHKGFLKRPSKENYQKAIKYQFDNLTDFIKTHGQPNDVFLLVGDHQPPILTNPEAHSLKTPVHVISQDKKYLENFDNYGFCKNIMDTEKHITHEGMYSIFLRTFAESYATSDSVPPEYEPNGLEL